LKEKFLDTGGGLFEARIRYGPGYRLYFVNVGKRVIVLP
jgi:putative component of toxin-antitoxin plasmid stabilization module